jgi:hypothetical protein
MKKQFDIIALDVWGNAREGFDVNAAYYTGRTIELDENASDRAINRALNVRGVVWSGDPDFSLYGDLKRNGRPVLELRASK